MTVDGKCDGVQVQYKGRRSELALKHINLRKGKHEEETHIISYLDPKEDSINLNESRAEINPVLCLQENEKKLLKISKGNKHKYEELCSQENTGCKGRTYFPHMEHFQEIFPYDNHNSKLPCARGYATVKKFETLQGEVSML